MKKLLFILPSLEIGGTLSSFISLYHQLKGKYDIDVFAISHDGDTCVPFQEDLLPKDILIHSYRCNYANTSGFIRLFTFFVKLLKRFLLSCKVDDSFIYTRLIRRLSSKYDVVIGFQEELPNQLASRVKAAQKYAWIHCDYSRHSGCGKELSIYSQFTKIVCVSKYTAAVFENYYPGLKENTTYIYNILDKDQIIEKSCESITDSRFINDKFTIISVGRIASVKRFEYVPAIAASMKEKGVSFIWYIIGPNLGDSCLQQLLDNIKYYNVEDCVVYLGGKSNPYPYFKHSNLLVSLSLSEACPMIFNEAKVLNVPAVSADFPSAYEFIKEGVNGEICSLDQMAAVLSGIIKNTDSYNSLVQNLSKESDINDDTLSKLNDLLD